MDRIYKKSFFRIDLVNPEKNLVNPVEKTSYLFVEEKMFFLISLSGGLTYGFTTRGGTSRLSVRRRSSEAVKVKYATAGSWSERRSGRVLSLR